MATDLERLVVQLSADIKGFERALERANNLTNSRSRSIERRFKSLQSSAAASFGAIQNSAIRAFAIIGGARGLQSLTDAGTRIDNSLKVAGLAGAELESVYNRLKDAALANAAPLETLSRLYGRLALVQGELGVNSDQIVSFSNNIALALRVSGQSAQETSGALLQLSQALGAGIVRAEEFNSIAEGAPVILQTAAAGIKQAEGSVAKLRQIMLKGNLSSKAFFDGLQAGSSTLDDKVANSVFTIGQRFENFQTILIDSVREFNKSTKAAETFGAEIDRVTNYVRDFNASQLILEIQNIITALQNGITATNNFLTSLGRLSGFDGIGEDIVNALGGRDGKVEFFGGALGIQSTKGTVDRRIEDSTERRLDLERQIATLRAGPSSAFSDNAIAILEQEVNVLKAGAKEVVEELRGQTPLEYGRFGPAGLNLNPVKAEVVPIDITESKYQVEAEKKNKKARKEKLDDYQKEVAKIKEKTEATLAETAAQEKLNPLINDYGYALEFARSKQELTNAALKAGKEITPELAAEIDKLAGAYAQSSVGAEKLAESQDKIREKHQEILDLQKDVTRGLVDDLIEGKSAADAFAGALKKIANALLDQAFSFLFSSTASGGAGGFGGLFGSIAKAIGFANGGFTGAGGKYEPAGVVHKGEYVIPKEVVDKVGVKNIQALFGKGYADGGLVGGIPSSPRRNAQSATGSGLTFNYSPRIDARGADVAAVARLEAGQERMRREFEARAVAAVQKARASNVKI